MRGIQVNLINSGDGTIDDNGTVIFDTVVNNQSTSVSYNSTTGEFTINQVGNYYVSWWVAVNGAASATTISFGVSLDSSAPIIASSAIVSDQLSGIALVSVTTAPSTLILVNLSGDTAFIGNTTVQGSLIILELSE